MKYLWKVENRSKWHFIFSRIIHVNLKNFSVQIVSALKGLQCIFRIFKFENSISIFQLIIKALFWIFKQLIEINIWIYTAYQCHLFGTSIIYLYFNPYCLATFSETEAACMVSTDWNVDMTWQCSFIGMGFTLLDGPVVSTVGIVLGF